MKGMDGYADQFKCRFRIRLPMWSCRMARQSLARHPLVCLDEPGDEATTVKGNISLSLGSTLR